MNNKGFTLIELTAIIVVLVAIFLVSFPSLLGLAKDNEEKQYDNMVSNICAAGKEYIYSNIEKYSEEMQNSGIIQIYVSTLIFYGNVDGSIINPKTDESINKDTLEYKVLSDKSLNCTYRD